MVTLTMRRAPQGACELKFNVLLLLMMFLRRAPQGACELKLDLARKGRGGGLSRPARGV